MKSIWVKKKKLKCSFFFRNIVDGKLNLKPTNRKKDQIYGGIKRKFSNIQAFYHSLSQNNDPLKLKLKKSESQLFTSLEKSSKSYHQMLFYDQKLIQELNGVKEIYLDLSYIKPNIIGAKGMLTVMVKKYNKVWFLNMFLYYSRLEVGVVYITMWYFAFTRGILHYKE